MNVWSADPRCKSFPPSADGAAPNTVGPGWNVLRDFSTPILVIKQVALRHNLALMRDYCAAHDVRIAPHGKTTMSPELIRAQLDHGGWGVTAATAWQAHTIAGFGVRRILLANECVDPVGLQWVVDAMSGGLEVLVFADSLAAVEAMRQVVGAIEGARSLPVLVEVGVPGGRAGARTVSAAVAVGRAVAAAPELELAGVAGFEGVVAESRADGVEPVRAFLAGIRTVATELMALDAFRPDHPVVLSAGGSMFFDLVVDVVGSDRHEYRRPVEVVLRSGCYVTHDHGAYAANSPFAGDSGGVDFQPALEAWSRVVSVPEDGLAIIDAGKRDVPVDAGMPVVLARLRDGRREPVPPLAVDHCNDQHGYVRVASANALRVGDLVALGLSHPCTAFDKWRAIPVVDHDYQVVDVVRTFF